jgi:hypothetical protein
MRIILFRKILESVAADIGKRIVANISNIEKVLAPENLKKLEDRHRGVFCFLAFHPTLDRFITSYIGLNSLSSDSGKEILVLFTLDADARFPRLVEIDESIDGIKIDESIHPAYQMTKMLFGPHAEPSLPGLLFFEKFTDVTEPIFVSLAKLDSASAVGERSRIVFSLVRESFEISKASAEASFPEEFAVRLAKKRIAYTRRDATSMREWLVLLYNFANDHSKEIFGLVGAIVGRKPKKKDGE